MVVENISISVKTTGAESAATKINALSLALERLQGTAQSTQGATQGVSSAMKSIAPAGKKASSAAKSTARDLDRVSKSAQGAQSSIGGFAKSLKRIAMYRILRTIIKEITQAIKDGLDSIYEFSKANNDLGNVSSSLDSLASAWQTVKNQLGAHFAQLLVALTPALLALADSVVAVTQASYPLISIINAISPIIVAITDAVTLLTNKLISLFSLLGLNVGMLVANDVTKSWKEADKAAGDYKRTILGFDVINRLDSPGGGGGGSGGGGFEISEIDTKNLPELKFEWVDALIDKIDIAIGKIKDLVAELAYVPDSVLVEVLEKDYATQPLEGLVQTVELFPLYATVIMAVQGNPVPLIQTVRSAIVNFVRESVGSFEELQTAYASACSTVEAESYSLAGSFDEIFASITETVNAWAANYAASADSVMVENATLGQDVVDTYNRLKNPLNEWVSHVWQKIGEYQEASGALQTENATLSSDIAMTYASIKNNIGEALSNAFTNIYTFATETWGAFREWSKGVSKAANSAFESLASAAYEGLSNAWENIMNWLNTTGSNIVSWASGTLSTIGQWAQGIAKNVASALKSAWESFKSFKEATGEAIDGLYEEHPFVMNLIFGTRNDFDGFSTSVPMIPAWSASSMLIPVFASGGVHDLSMGSLFIAGEAGAEIVANMGNGRTGVTNVEQMESAVANGNLNVVNAVYAMANMIVRAVESKDFDITLDGESLADKMYYYNQNATNRHGTAMVT